MELLGLFFWDLLGGFGGLNETRPGPAGEEAKEKKGRARHEGAWDQPLGEIERSGLRDAEDCVRGGAFPI